MLGIALIDPIDRGDGVHGPDPPSFISRARASTAAGGCKAARATRPIIAARVSSRQVESERVELPIREEQDYIQSSRFVEGQQRLVSACRPGRIGAARAN